MKVKELIAFSEQRRRISLNYKKIFKNYCTNIKNYHILKSGFFWLSRAILSVNQKLLKKHKVIPTNRTPKNKLRF